MALNQLGNYDLVTDCEEYFLIHYGSLFYLFIYYGLLKVVVL